MQVRAGRFDSVLGLHDGFQRDVRWFVWWEDNYRQDCILHNVHYAKCRRGPQGTRTGPSGKSCVVDIVGNDVKTLVRGSWAPHSLVYRVNTFGVHPTHSRLYIQISTVQRLVHSCDFRRFRCAPIPLSAADNFEPPARKVCAVSAGHFGPNPICEDNPVPVSSSARREGGW